MSIESNINDDALTTSDKDSPCREVRSCLEILEQHLTTPRVCLSTEARRIEAIGLLTEMAAVFRMLRTLRKDLSGKLIMEAYRNVDYRAWSEHPCWEVNIDKLLPLPGNVGIDITRKETAKLLGDFLLVTEHSNGKIKFEESFLRLMQQDIVNDSLLQMALCGAGTCIRVALTDLYNVRGTVPECNKNTAYQGFLKEMYEGYKGTRAYDHTIDYYRQYRQLHCDAVIDPKKKADSIRSSILHVAQAVSDSFLGHDYESKPVKTGYKKFFGIGKGKLHDHDQRLSRLMEWNDELEMPVIDTVCSGHYLWLYQEQYSDADGISFMQLYQVTLLARHDLEHFLGVGEDYRRSKAKSLFKTFAENLYNAGMLCNGRSLEDSLNLLDRLLPLEGYTKAERSGQNSAAESLWEIVRGAKQARDTNTRKKPRLYKEVLYLQGTVALFAYLRTKKVYNAECTAEAFLGTLFGTDMPKNYARVSLGNYLTVHRNFDTDDDYLAVKKWLDEVLEVFFKE